jgi:CRISPR/Cas system-associated endoribonuclease Cas2
MLYIVAYDLHNPGRTYEPVIEAIKATGGWAHVEKSVWIVDSLMSSQELLEVVRKAADSNDAVFVAQLEQNWWGVNLSAGVVQWLKDSSRRW